MQRSWGRWEPNKGKKKARMPEEPECWGVKDEVTEVHRVQTTGTGEVVARF